MAAEDKSDGGVVAIVGAGPGNGDAFARRFARAGQPVALLARTLERLERSPAQISGAKPFACDVTDPGSIVLSLDAVARELGPIETVIYNAGKGVWGDPASISPADFEEMWRVNAFEAFLVARHVIPSMVSHGRGEIIFIGATLDDYLRAIDIETGEVLWKGRLPAGGQATPMTYRIRPDGKQYVVIAAGGHGRAGTTLGDSVIAFALPE